jgi:hypothetical protein
MNDLQKETEKFTFIGEIMLEEEDYDNALTRFDVTGEAII